MMRAFALLAAFACAGCATTTKSPITTAPNWKRVVTPADLGRLRGWRDAFVTALAQARASGNGAAIAREGDLLAPDAAIAPVALRAGRYACRTIKIGYGRDTPTDAARLAYVAYGRFDCDVVEGGAVDSFVKRTGSQRPIGRLYTDTAERLIFIGTLLLGDEGQPFEYGTDADRDMAGAVQRIGPDRWRLVLPYPRFESTLDVIELVPASVP